MKNDCGTGHSNSQLTVSTIVCEEGDRRVVVSLIDNLVCLSLMLHASGLPACWAVYHAGQRGSPLRL